MWRFSARTANSKPSPGRHRNRKYRALKSTSRKVGFLLVPGLKQTVFSLSKDPTQLDEVNQISGFAINCLKKHWNPLQECLIGRTLEDVIDISTQSINKDFKY